MSAYGERDHDRHPATDPKRDSHPRPAPDAAAQYIANAQGVSIRRALHSQQRARARAGLRVRTNRRRLSRFSRAHRGRCRSLCCGRISPTAPRCARCPPWRADRRDRERRRRRKTRRQRERMRAYVRAWRSAEQDRCQAAFAMKIGAIRAVCAGASVHVGSNWRTPRRAVEENASARHHNTVPAADQRVTYATVCGALSSEVVGVVPLSTETNRKCWFGAPFHRSYCWSRALVVAHPEDVRHRLHFAAATLHRPRSRRLNRRSPALRDPDVPPTFALAEGTPEFCRLRRRSAFNPLSTACGAA
jgi:hypothetical protein